ncbi:MAG: tetratricopeptide repeat protein [Caldilineaceae bacterium]
MTEIGRLLLGEPACRLLNIFGPGGIGKTRLALAAVTAIRAEYPDGAFFVALASIGEAVFIVPAIAEALQFTFFGATDPTEQLIAHLRDKKLLLLLDNFEHLLDGASLLATILHQAPEITVLTTSRTRLHLQEEWVYTVDGLPFPAVHDPSGALVQPEADLNSYAAIQLFLQRARQTKPGFVPAAEEMAAIGRICQLVAGVPLGVELAAPWIRTLSCREIAAEIELSLDFLTSPVRNLPERHRSLRVVLEQTWQLLPTAGQAVLQHLSVFRGGSTREAAEQVAGATLPILTLLVDKALLRRTNTGRYELHELIRQFAEQQAEAGQTLKRAQHAHCEYFVAFLEARTARVKGSGQKDAIAEIKADIDNVRLVWRQAINNQDARIIERCAECLFVFYLYSSGHYEGETAFQQAAAAFTVGPGLTAELAAVDKQENLAAFLLAGQGYFLGRTRNPFGGQTCVEQALELLRRAKIVDRHVEGFARLWLGWMYLLQGNTDTSAANVEPTLALLIETGDCWGEGWCRLLWANMLSIVYPLEAEPIYASGLAVCRASGDLNTLGYTAHARSEVIIMLGRYAEAKHYIDEAIQAFERSGNVLGLGYALLKQGLLDVALGAYEHAILFFEQAEAKFFATRTEGNIIWAQIELGMACRLSGDYGRAEELYRHCLDASAAANDLWHVAQCLLGLGCLAYDQGQLGHAEAYQREALALHQQLALEVRVAEGLRHLGHVLVAAGEHRFAAAKQAFHQCLVLTVKHQLAPIALDVCVGAARLHEHEGKTQAAAQLLTLAADHEAATFETKQKARLQLRAVMSQLQLAQAQVVPPQGLTPALWATVDALIAYLVAVEPSIPAAGSAVAQ